MLCNVDVKSTVSSGNRKVPIEHKLSKATFRRSENAQWYE